MTMRIAQTPPIPHPYRAYPTVSELEVVTNYICEVLPYQISMLLIDPKRVTDAILWCREQFGDRLTDFGEWNLDARWDLAFTSFYFGDEDDAALFKLFFHQ